MKKTLTQEERELNAFAYESVMHRLKFAVPEAPNIWKHAQFKSHFEKEINVRILEFRLRFLSNRSPQVDPVLVPIPSNPFEHALEAWAPQWLLKLRPVRYKVRAQVPPVDIRVCPHHDIDFKRGRVAHARFVARGGK